MIRFEEAVERHRLGRLSADEAGEALGMSGRQLRRLRVRYLAGGGDEAAGADGAVSGGVGAAALSHIAWPSQICWDLRLPALRSRMEGILVCGHCTMPAL